MKNTLFATTALVALGVAGTAFASEPLTASVGGYMGIGVQLKDNPAGDDVGILRDGEIHFKAKGSSDNGLTFEVRVEMEAFGDNDQIDENYAKVTGSFGSVMIGGNDTALNNMATGIFYAPLALGGYYDHITSFGYSRADGRTGLDQAGDQMGIHYTTPNVGGFQASISYQPEGSSDNVNDGQFAFNDSTDGDNIISFGANYGAEFDNFSVRLSAGYETADGADQDIWSAGAQAGVAGFMVGAYWEENKGDDTSDVALGMTYSTGPWTVGAGGSLLLDAAGDPFTLGAWATYAMAPGVSATLSLEHRDNGTDDQSAALAYIALGF